MIKIHKEFIPYELSLKLKQVGFQEECMGYYTCSLTSVKHETDGYSGPFGWKKGEVSFDKSFFINNNKNFDYSNENWLYCGAPLYQQVFRWFRENHKLGVQATRDGGEWHFNIVDYSNEQESSPQRNLIHVNLSSEDYEEAELACLEKLIEIVESKTK